MLAKARCTSSLNSPSSKLRLSKKSARISRAIGFNRKECHLFNVSGFQVHPTDPEGQRFPQTNSSI